MANVIEELVRVNAFKSKAEARNMIKNGGVSIIPCINEDYEVPIFEVEENDKGEWVFNEPVNVDGKVVNQVYKNGYIISPNGNHIPAKLWDVRDCNLELLAFREHLMHDTAHNSFFSMSIANPDAGKEYFKVSDWDKENNRPKRIYRENATMVVITWDKSFGKNPWLINDINVDINIHNGDIIKIGKRTIVIGE